MQYALEYHFDASYSRLYSWHMNIGSRLDTAMRAAGFGTNQSALHRDSGVPQPTINRILKGKGKKGPETDTVRKLAAACKVTFEWLNEGIGPMVRTEANQERAHYGNDSPHTNEGSPVKSVEENEENLTISKVRKVKLRLSAGVTGFSVEQEEEDSNPIYFRKDWLSARGFKPENLIALRVKGESMEPNLHGGDTVVINTSDTTPKDGDVFAVNYEGECVVKRLVRDAGTWWLSSDNTDQRRFQRKECSGEMCLLIGRVIHKQSEKI